MYMQFWRLHMGMSVYLGNHIKLFSAKLSVNSCVDCVIIGLNLCYPMLSGNTYLN